MRLAIERRGSLVHRLGEPNVAEVITPRTNVAALTSAENLFAALALSEPLSLEIAADHRSRRFLVRTATTAMHRHVASQLAAAYPQADLRAIDSAVDPARLFEGEQVAACTLRLRAAPYLPIRTFQDVEVDAARSAQVDPLLGIL